AVYFKVKPEKQSAVKNLYLGKYIQALHKNDIKFATTASIIKTSA
ncbi:MAG: mechanosensitive ion channel family protein, partial [Lactobacillus sp.]|nr:mechanosensitive ion channel family protein [Lactobacillus sp.]